MVSRVLLVLIVQAFVVKSAVGAIDVDWRTGSPSGSTGAVQLVGQVLYPANSVFFGYWSSDTINSFNPSDPFNPGLNDDFLGAYSSGATPGKIDEPSPSLINYPAYSGGYVYMVAYNLSYTTYTNNPGTIPFDTAYGVSVMAGPVGVTPESFSTEITRSAPLILNQTVVPEPTTMGLLVAGAGVIAWRRSRREKRK